AISPLPLGAGVRCVCGKRSRTILPLQLCVFLCDSVPLRGKVAPTGYLSAPERTVRTPNTDGVDRPLLASNRPVIFFLSAVQSAGIRYSTSKKRTTCSGLRRGPVCSPAFFPSTSTSQALGPRFSLLYVTINVAGCTGSTGRSKENHLVALL